MNSNSAEISGFDLLSRVVCCISLCASFFTGWAIIGSIRPGFYGGTALLIGLVVFAQMVALVFAVIVPAIVLFFCRRLRMSRLAWMLLAIAILAVAAETWGLSVVPVTGNC